MGFRDSEPLLKELKQKSRNVLVFSSGDVLSRNLTKSGGRFLGSVDAEELTEFLNKFGRRLHIDDFFDNLFDKRAGRWEIDFQLLYSGYLFFSENRSDFKEAVKKCRDKKEFMIACGMR